MDLTPKPGPLRPDPLASSKPRIPMPSSLPPRSMQPSGFVSVPLLLSNPLRRNIPSKLDDVRVNGWLDAMIASSPGKNLNKSLTEVESDGADVAYISWTLKYPSALTSFDQIINYAQGKQIALFLDYDGTLTPIVEEPDCAFMSHSMRNAVRKVAKYFPTAIISGRSRDKVFEFVKLKELYYAGSHGMDIMGPVTESLALNDHPNCIRSMDREVKEFNLFQPAREFIPMIEEVFESLVESTKDIPGAHVENNKFCVSVHYRLVEVKDWPVIAQYVHDILKGYPRLRLTHGRKVLEVRPVIDWNKGKAVEFLLESLGLNGGEDVLPIYIGDDRTDEDAFKVLKEKNIGFGILVSSVPKESDAFYSLREPAEVMEFLKSLVHWKKLAAR